MLQSAHLYRLNIALSCVLLFMVSACSLTPDLDQAKQPQPIKSQSSNYTIDWIYAFYNIDMGSEGGAGATQPWHDAPDWMYGQGQAYKSPRPADMPGEYQAPSPTNTTWTGAILSAPFPGEDGDPSHTPTLVSYFSYGNPDYNNYGLYFYGLHAYVSGDLPPSGNGDYRQFKLVTIEPVRAVAPNIQYLITYNIEVLGSGPGGPLVDIERHTLLATYSFATSSGYYE
jgi:hypothetical protein